jgi:predicted transposase YdaD
MSLPFDAALKAIIAPRPADFAPVFQFPALQPAQALNLDLSTLSAATDVAFGFGDPLQEIVDLNFQSGPDATLAARLHLYNAAFHLRYSVPVRSVLVLLRPKADWGDLTGNLAYVAGGKRLEFEYDVVRMWQQPVEPFLHGGLGLLPLAPLCRMPEDQPLADALREVVREIDRRLAQEAEHAQAVRLMTAAFILTGLRVAKETLAGIYDGVRIMHESTAYDVILEEGCAKGELRASHRLLLRQGRQRFGPADAATEAALTSIQDLDRLERMADAVLTAASWPELLATP